MAAITFRSPDDTPAVVVGDNIPPGPLRDLLGEDEMSNQLRAYHAGGADEPQMFEITVQPNCGPPAHAHAEGEIMYVLEGEMHVGRRKLTPGCSVYIPGYTLYSFRAGPQGLRFLNFRARKDSGLITKDELVAMRRAPAPD